MDFDSSYSQTSTRASLLRFRSAPGSLFANVDPHHGLFESRFNLDDEDNDKDNDFVSESGGKIYGMNSQLPPQYPRQVGGNKVGPIDGGYRVERSMGMDLQGQSAKNLLRQNSSPVGYDTIRDVGSYRGENASSGDFSLSSSRLKGEMNYSSGLSSSSLGMLTRISESEKENYGVSTGADGAENLGNENGGDAQFYSHSFPFGAWNDSLSFEENLSSIIKTEVDDGMKSFGDLQSTEVINRPPVLSHHMSLPKTSAEMAAAEKVLQFQDTIPCKIRAKRGCATHPRSIAERVRRTKISERMRKLQDLVPNMDKQTNTADMLDLAVEYIKSLQQQHKSLTDTRANCKCTTLQKQV